MMFPRALISLAALAALLSPTSLAVLASSPVSCSTSTQSTSLACQTLARGVAALEQHNPAQAEPLFTRALQQAPGLATAHFYRAVARYELTRYRSAQSDLLAAYPSLPSLHGVHPSTWRGLLQAAHLAQTQANTSYVGGLEGLALDDQSHAWTLFTDAIRRSPHWADAYAHRGIASAELGNLQGAIGDEQTALGIDTRNVTALDELGYMDFNRGNNARALAYYTHALSIDPTLEDAWANLGAVRNAQGDYRGAYTDESRAIVFDPYSAFAYLNRSGFASDLGMNQQALHDANAAVRLGPTIPAAWQTRAFARHNLGDQRGAIADDSMAIRLDPQYGIAYDDRGLAEEQVHEYTSALTDLNTALSLDPTDSYALEYRCLVRYDTNKYALATADCNQALALRPTDAQAYLTLGSIAFTRRDYKGARHDWQRAETLYNAQGNADGAALAKNNLAFLPPGV